MRKESVFVDTSAWFAYVNADDPDHQQVRQFFDSYSGRLVTSTYIFDETVTLVQARLGHRNALIAERTLLDPQSVELIHITPADESAAWTLFEKRSDKSYSFTDCTSFVVMRGQKFTMAVAIDDHFIQAGFRVEPRKR